LVGGLEDSTAFGSFFGINEEKEKSSDGGRAGVSLYLDSIATGDSTLDSTLNVSNLVFIGSRLSQNLLILKHSLSIHTSELCMKLEKSFLRIQPCYATHFLPSMSIMNWSSPSLLRLETDSMKEKD
jgi:hypothetical protein